MDLLTLRAAAGGGTVDGIDAARLVAAGFTLLQRSPALVRALAGRRAAILLPTSPQFLVALAASDGRGAVLVNPLATAPEIAYELQDANVGAVFTLRALAHRLPPGTEHALLDDAPTSATVVAADGTSSRVDLGSHFGLELEGDPEEPGRDEECVIVYTSAMAGRPLGAILTHRNLLANARQAVQAAQFVAGDHLLALLPYSHPFALTASAIAPLIAGARVSTMARFNAIAAVDRIADEGVSILVGVPAIFEALLRAIARQGAGFAAPSLRICLCGGAPLSTALQDRWAAITGVELRQGPGLTESSPIALCNSLSDPNRRGALGVPHPGVRGDEDGLHVRDGWLHTGDRGVENADGTFPCRGLLTPMFTRNGFNLHPREVEVAVDEGGHVSEAEVKARTDALLSAHERPSRITFTGEVS